jgi:putative tricarboxylic transport membrane protein
MYIGNVVGLVIVIVAVPWFAAILRIPFALIASLIIVVCAIGAFSVKNAYGDIVTMLVFGVVGYVMKKLQYPLAPMVLAVVLGDRTEQAFRQSLLISQGDMTIFWSKPLVASIMALAFFVLLWPLFQKWTRKAEPRVAQA